MAVISLNLIFFVKFTRPIYVLTMVYQQLSIVWICKKLNSSDTSLIEKKMKNYNYLKVYYKENETKIAKN